MKPQDIYILIGCEESQAVTKAFRALGFQAFSCDILPCSGGHSEWHYQQDIFEVLKMRKWDFVITFPPCTHLAVSGAKHFDKKRADGRQEEGIRFFFELWKHSDCAENPIGILNGGEYIKKWFPELHADMVKAGFPFKPAQIIQPYEYGDAVKKGTCLWLKDIPRLKSTHNVENQVEYYTSPQGKKMSAWNALQIVVNGKKRGYNTSEFKQHRSKTFPGIATAMADQWGNYLLTKDLL